MNQYKTLTPQEKTIKNFLIKCAISKKFITYQNLSRILKLGLDMNIPKDRTTIGELLCNVSRVELQEQQNAPILSALVLTINEKSQGDGFYKLCEELGYGEWQQLKRNEKFSKERIDECYEFYSKLKK